MGYTRCGASRAGGASAPGSRSRADRGEGARVESYIALTYWDLAAASVLVFIDAGLSIIFRLRVHRLTQLPDGPALHDQSEGRDQHRALSRRQQMQPYRCGD